MNRFIAFLLSVLVVAVSANAASPTLENFDQRHFRTNGPLPGVIETRLSSGNFDQSGDTWSITNVTGAAGSTLWTNDTSVGVTGRLKPITGLDYAYLYPSNLWLRGWNAVYPEFRALTAGTEALNAEAFSSFLLFSDQTNASLALINLTPGAVDGQDLTLMSYTNAEWQGRFILPANSAVGGFGGRVVLANDQDWVAGNGSILSLKYINPNWWETGRYVAGTNVTFVTNTYNNVTVTNLEVINNITIKGKGNVSVINPTDGRVPYRVGTNTLGDSPWFRHTTNIMSFGSGTNQFLWQPDADSFTLGWKAGGNRTISFNNVALGREAMEAADGQFNSVAIGNYALENHGGSVNTAVGHQAMQVDNATALTAFGGNNTAIGAFSMKGITNGDNNVAVGASALRQVGNGLRNTAVGTSAGDGFHGHRAVFYGFQAGLYSPNALLTNVGAIGYAIKATNDNDFVLGNDLNRVIIPGTLSVSGGLENNLGARLSAGNTDYVDLFKASQTNDVSAAVAIAHATNGVPGFEYTHARWFVNGSGADRTLTIPSSWRTNVYSAVPPALTNNTTTIMYVKSSGPTSSSALQTNVYVSFEYYK